MPPDHLKLCDTAFWTWHLYPNQGYLGRVQFTLLRGCEGSLADLTIEEWDDLRSSIRAYETLARDLFNPDRFNYKQLGNQWHQVHVHAIPRYPAHRTWQGIEFVDQRFGDDPHPEFASPIDEATTVKLAKWLRSKLAESA